LNAELKGNIMVIVVRRIISPVPTTVRGGPE